MAADQISAIIPLYNCPQFIGEAVHSILEQTLPAFEIIVVDDGSTDNSLAAVPQHPKIRLIPRPHAGLAATLNHGVSCALGSILTFLDNDDRWLPTKLEQQVAQLRSEAKPDLIFCQARVFHDGDRHYREHDAINGVSKSGMMLRRSVFDQIGPFPEAANQHDFIGWYARAKELGLSTTIVPEILYERRIHDQNDGILQRDRQRSNYFSSIKAIIDRRRQQQARDV